MLQYSDKFIDLDVPDVRGPLARLEGQARPPTPDGHLIGYGTDIGPEAICYRADLFEAAGLPTDREEVAKPLRRRLGRLLRRRQAVQPPRSQGPFFDSAGATYQGMINQVETAYENPSDGTIIADREPRGQGRLRPGHPGRRSPTACRPSSAQWSDDWTASFQKDGFATMLCPGWMLGVIEGNAEGVKGWDVADVFPGGGGNWGGSYLTVPEAGQARRGGPGARRLADRARAAGQGLQERGHVPEPDRGAREPGRCSRSTNAFFNDAPAGQIFADRAKAVTVDAVQGPELLRRSTTRCSRR